MAEKINESTDSGLGSLNTTVELEKEGGGQGGVILPPQNPKSPTQNSPNSPTQNSPNSPTQNSPNLRNSEEKTIESPSVPEDQATSSAENEKRRIELIHMNHEPRFKSLGCTFPHCKVGPFKTFNQLVKHCEKFHKSSKFKCEFCGLYLQSAKDKFIHQGMIFIFIT